MRSTLITAITVMMVMLGAACARPATPVEDELYERFSSDSDHWEFLLTTDVQTGSDPPSSPFSNRTGAWRPLDELSDQDFRSLAGLWLRTVLPSSVRDDPHLLISGSAGTFAIYVDDALIYRHGDFQVDRPVLEPHSLYHIIPMPPGFTGQDLHIWRPHPITESLDYLDMVLTSDSNVPSIVGELYLDQVREGLVDLLFGLLFLAIGIALALVSPLQWKSQGRSLLLLGLAAIMYGTRLLAELTTLHILVGWPEPVWRYLTAIITYIIPIPVILWFREIFGWGWKSTIRIFLYVQGTYATVAIALALYTGIPDFAMFLNTYLVLAMMLIIVVALHQTHMLYNRNLYLVSGFLILSIINENLVGANLVPWELEFETLGWFVGFFALSIFAVRRYFRYQHDLQAIEIELQTARDIQASILPDHGPALAGLDIAVRYVPMSEVAGDFYDFVKVDETSVGIMIADVMGHGVPAALIASMVKIAFESQTPVASDPAKVLSGMNQTFCGNLQDQFITAGYLFLDISRSEMIYAGAGHPPLLLQRTSTGEISECGENGLLFAGFEHAEYSNDRKALQSGDRLVLFTDGIIEANNIHEEQFGMTRLQDFMTGNSSLGAAEFADALIGHLSRWSGRKSMDDDLTLVVMDFTGPQ